MNCTLTLPRTVHAASIEVGDELAKGGEGGRSRSQRVKNLPFPSSSITLPQIVGEAWSALSCTHQCVCVCSPQENRFGRLLLIATCCADLVYTSPQSKWTVNVIVFVRTVRLTSCDACLELGQIFLLWLYGNGSLLHSSTDTTHPFLFILTASPCRCRCKSWRLFLGALVRAGIDWHCIIHPTNSSEW